MHLNHTFYIHHIPKEDVPLYYLNYLMHGYYYPISSIGEVEPYFTKDHDIIDYTMSDIKAAGAITSNSSDLNTFAKAISTGKLLKPEQFKEQTSIVDGKTGQPLPNGVDKDHPFGYGLGIEQDFISLLDGVNALAYGHGGGTLGFGSRWYYFPATGASYVAVLNSTYTGDEPGNLLNEINTFIYEHCF